MVRVYTDRNLTSEMELGRESWLNIVANPNEGKWLDNYGYTLDMGDEMAKESKKIVYA